RPVAAPAAAAPAVAAPQVVDDVEAFTGEVAMPQERVRHEEHTASISDRIGEVTAAHRGESVKADIERLAATEEELDRDGDPTLASGISIDRQGGFPDMKETMLDKALASPRPESDAAPAAEESRRDEMKEAFADMMGAPRARPEPAPVQAAVEKPEPAETSSEEDALAAAMAALESAKTIVSELETEKERPPAPAQAGDPQLEAAIAALESGKKPGATLEAETKPAAPLSDNDHEKLAAAIESLEKQAKPGSRIRTGLGHLTDPGMAAVSPDQEKTPAPSKPKPGGDALLGDLAAEIAAMTGQQAPVPSIKPDAPAAAPETATGPAELDELSAAIEKLGQGGGKTKEPFAVTRPEPSAAVKQELASLADEIAALTGQPAAFSDAPPPAAAPPPPRPKNLDFDLGDLSAAIEQLGGGTLPTEKPPAVAEPSPLSTESSPPYSRPTPPRTVDFDIGDLSAAIEQLGGGKVVRQDAPAPVEKDPGWEDLVRDIKKLDEKEKP
ncbi:MAG: hypothetical protein C4523_14435, partial [Myxococcales bacterium]